jgi:hypothetical protein
MTLPKSILEQLTGIDNLKESLLGNSYSKILEQFKEQETQYQKLVKNSLTLPESTFQAINAINASNRLYADSLNSPFKKLVEDSLFRPPKFIDSLFGSTTSKLFKELSESPLKQFNKLAYPDNPIDLMVSKHIQDFEKRYKDSIKLFPSEISSAIAISKMLGPVGINTQYEEILKELQRVENEENVEVGLKFNRNEIILFLLAQLMSLLVVLYQDHSSNQMEERLGNKIDTNTKALEKQINKVELLMQRISQLDEIPFKNAEYIVKDRSALIREEPKNGSKVIAHIFPNQVVTIIDSEGKWIEVTYYDWAKRNYMNGWVLKKYLQRIKLK